MRGILSAALMSTCLAGPALAQSPPIGEMVSPAGVARADADGDRIVTTDEFKAHVGRVLASVVEENRRRWAVMIRVLDGPSGDRIHVRKFHELNERFKRRIDADGDGKPSRQEIADYARQVSLPGEMIGDLERAAEESFSAEAEIDEAAMKEIERAFDEVPEDEAYISSDGGAGSGSDGRWVPDVAEGYMRAWRKLAEDGSYRLP